MNNINEELFYLNQRRISEMLIHCKESVPIYAQRLKNISISDIKKINYVDFSAVVPILEKKDVRKYSSLVLSKKYKYSELVQESTSGTTGEPTLCFKSKNEKILCGIRLWKERKKFAPMIKPDSKHAHFYSFRQFADKFHYEKIYEENNNLNLSLFNLDDKVLIEYWERIISFETKWLMGPPSAIYMLAITIEKYNLINYDLQLIELTGEFVNDIFLNKIKEVFRCPVTIHYGCREFWGIGYGEDNNNLRVLEDFYIESVYNKEIDKNEIIVTSLTNKAWPLIRYKMLDIANLYKDKNNVFYLQLLGGRTTDYCFLSNKKRISPILVTSIARIINAKLKKDAIVQCQLVKLSDKSIRINITLNNHNDASRITNLFNYYITNVIGDNIYIEYFFGNIIIDKKTGKVRDFIDLSIK